MADYIIDDDVFDKWREELENDFDPKQALRRCMDAYDAALSRIMDMHRERLAAERRADESGFRRGLEAAVKAAASVGRPVGAGDGDTYVPGTSADAVRAIRAIPYTPPGERP